MDLSNKKILICDDSVLARKQLMDAVKEVGDNAEFIEAKNGVEAVEKFEEFSPDLTFLDIVMPEKDGTEALADIKKIQPNAVTIIVSSVGTQEQLKKAIQLGAKDFVQKPFDKRQVAEIIESRLGGK